MLEKDIIKNQLSFTEKHCLHSGHFQIEIVRFDGGIIKTITCETEIEMLEKLPQVRKEWKQAAHVIPAFKAQLYIQ